MVLLQIFLQIIGNRAFLLLASVDVSSSGLFYNIDIAYEFFIFTDRHMDRRNFLSVQLSQAFHYFPVAYIVHIHLGHKEHAGQIVLFTHLPGFLCSHLYP